MPLATQVDFNDMFLVIFQAMADDVADKFVQNQIDLELGFLRKRLVRGTTRRLPGPIRSISMRSFLICNERRPLINAPPPAVRPQNCRFTCRRSRADALAFQTCAPYYYLIRSPVVAADFPGGLSDYTMKCRGYPVCARLPPDSNKIQLGRP